MKLGLFLVAALLVGCANQPNSAFSQMTPEQLKAVHADKNITIVCSSVKTLTTDVTNIYAVIDKTTIPQGALTINEMCEVQLSTLK